MDSLVPFAVVIGAIFPRLGKRGIMLRASVLGLIFDGGEDLIFDDIEDLVDREL